MCTWTSVPPGAYLAGLTWQCGLGVGAGPLGAGWDAGDAEEGSQEGDHEGHNDRTLNPGGSASGHRGSGPRPRRPPGPSAALGRRKWSQGLRRQATRAPCPISRTGAALVVTGAQAPGHAGPPPHQPHWGGASGHRGLRPQAARAPRPISRTGAARVVTGLRPPAARAPRPNSRTGAARVVTGGSSAAPGLGQLVLSSRPTPPTSPGFGLEGGTRDPQGAFIRGWVKEQTLPSLGVSEGGRPWGWDAEPQRGRGRGLEWAATVLGTHGSQPVEG